MFPLMLPMLIGAGGGLLLNKKDPLKGALLGAGLGAAGGAFAPGLLGGAGAAGSASAAGAGAAGGAAEGGLLAFNAAKDSQLANAAMGSEALAGYGGAVSPALPVNGQGMFAQLKDAAAAAKPFGDAAGAAMQVNGLLGGGQQQPVQPAQMPQNVGGNQILAQLAQQGQQEQQMTMQADMERRKRRMGLLGGVA